MKSKKTCSSQEKKWKMQSMKVGNAAGNDGAPMELLKSDGTIEPQCRICNLVWKTGRWPSQWLESLIIIVEKKRLTGNCINPYIFISIPRHVFDISYYSDVLRRKTLIKTAFLTFNDIILISFRYQCNALKRVSIRIGNFTSKQLLQAFI